MKKRINPLNTQRSETYISRFPTLNRFAYYLLVYRPPPRNEKKSYLNSGLFPEHRPSEIGLEIEKSDDNLRRV